MNKLPKVSIVIPVYNGEKYIKEAIESAINQTYKNTEIIVVNDGSTDLTDQICKQYKNKIRYYKKKNGGVSTALNLAISKMKGEYFSWLSHDDLLYPNKIEENIKYADNNTIILSDFEFINADGTHMKDVILNHDLIEHINQAALLFSQINGITLLIPKKAFDECGGFDEKLKCTQDYDMWYRMMLKGYKFKHIEKILTATRVHDQQTTQTNPNVLKEGYVLWKGMVDKAPLKLKKETFITEYGFYKNMYMFLKNTAYSNVAEYIYSLCKKIKSSASIKEKKISVIIPILDETIDDVEKSIDSVINQTYKNFEIILVNNNTSYNNKKNIKRLIKSDNIRIISGVNPADIANSFNYGISKSIGEYVAFLKAGDEFNNDKLKQQFIEMELSKSMCSHTSYVCRKVELDGTQKTTINAGNQNGYIVQDAIYNSMISVSTLMINKKFLEDNNLYFKDNLTNAGTNIFILSVLKHTPILGIDEVYAVVNNNYSNEELSQEKFETLEFVMSDKYFSHYKTSVANLALEYANSVLINKKIQTDNTDNNINTDNADSATNSIDNTHITNDSKLKIILKKIKRFFWLYKNDRPLLIRTISKKLFKHPKLHKTLKKIYRFIKKIKKKNV